VHVHCGPRPNPSGHGCVAFLRIRLRGSKPTRFAPGLRRVRVQDRPSTLGEHLLATRVARGVSQKELARELGVDQVTVGNWEKGRRSPALRHLPSLYRWLGFCPVEPSRDSIGGRLVAWRKAQGLSQREVADRLGLDPGTLSRTEQGKLGSPNRRIRRAIEMLFRMSDILPES
jgi:transcriptional regulator with XRE-family HTH domain